MQYEVLNATNKVYAHSMNKTQLYEQPQTTPLLVQCVNLPKTSTPLRTPPMNPKNLTEHIVILHKPSSNATTPKLVNIIRCKKGQATFHVVGSTMVKKQYSSVHKTMAKAIEKRRKLLMESLHQIHANTMVS